VTDGGGIQDPGRGPGLAIFGGPAPRGCENHPVAETLRLHRARCNVCGVIVHSDHPWHVSTCDCGLLSLSGGPELRRVSWRADPGASWTDLSDAVEEEDTMDGVEVRPMTDADVPDAERVWYDASSTMRASYHLPVEDRTDEVARHMETRIAHLLATDPGGSWVAVDGSGAVIGMAQAFVRDDLWVLSLLGVSPRFQDRGAGKALLDAAVSYGRGAPRGLILCSRDPRAARRYLRAGFDMHPPVTGWGAVDRRRVPATPNVRAGTVADLELVAALDRRLRGGAHGPDLEHLLAEGCDLLVHPGRGYVVVRRAKPVFLAAEGEAEATELLWAALARAEDGETVEVNWITSPQQWALRAVAEAGLELHPVGPVMVRGMSGPPRNYLPSGAYG
jgi:ribosomal protein S18 acetylase RimI-like enzyme